MLSPHPHTDDVAITISYHGSNHSTGTSILENANNSSPNLSRKRRNEGVGIEDLTIKENALHGCQGGANEEVNLLLMFLLLIFYH